MLTVLIAISLCLLGWALSFGITVGLIYLICLCFSLKFSLAVATGIWLVLEIARSVFKK